MNEAGTVTGYFGKIEEKIKNETPFLKDVWEGHIIKEGAQGWYLKLLDSLRDAYTSKALEEGAFVDPKCRPVHLKSTGQKGVFMQLEQHWKDVLGVDLDFTIKQLLVTERTKNDTECYKNSLKLIIIYYIVSCGYELKLSSHLHNIWDFWACCLQGTITRLKSRSQQSF